MAEIITYHPDELRDKFIKKDNSLNYFFASDFNKFFVVREEDLINLIKLPIPPIRTTSNLLIFLTQGFIEMNVGITTYQVFSNNCLVVPAGQVFSMGTPDSPDVKGFFCSFDNDATIGKLINADLLKNFEFLNQWGQHLIKVNDTSAIYICQLFERLLIDYSSNGKDNISIIQSYLFALLCELKQAYLPGQNTKNNQYTLITNRFKTLLYNKKAHIQVAYYAAQLNITPNHLNKVLKATTGKSTSSWIEEMLIMEAKVLLGNTSFTINQVSAEIGIEDPAYFSRLFKKSGNMTPTEYRKMIEKS